MSKPDAALILAHSVLAQCNDADSDVAVLARGVIRHHAASVAVQAALVQSLAMETHYLKLLTNSHFRVVEDHQSESSRLRT
jgi:alanine dehydrogenase